MKLLVLTDKYFPRPYANALCAQELIDIWSEQGHTVDVLAYEDFDGMPAQWKGSSVYYVRPDERLRLFYYADTNRDTKKGKLAQFTANVLSKAKGALLLPWQPFYSLSFPRRIYGKMCELQEQNHYDGIVAILKPLDSNIAACKFKLKYPSIPYVVFCVDSLRKTAVEQHLGKEFADAFIWQKKLLQNCDAFFYMRSRREDYAPARYDPFRSKLRESDMPRFRVKDVSQIPPYDFGESGEHWVYAGSIGAPHYHPDEMLEIFRNISRSPKRILHLYTRGAYADRIAEKAKAENLNVRTHGYVDAATLERVMAAADVIVSLKTSDQISAKIFECMSYGKPVVHFSGHRADPNASYVEKYPLGKIVRMYEDDLPEQVKQLEQFLSEASGKTVDMDKLSILFRMSTPEYSASEILKIIEKREDGA